MADPLFAANPFEYASPNAAANASGSIASSFNDAAFRRAVKTNQTLEQLIRATGETPPEPPKPNFFFRALEKLNTLGDYTRGAIAHAADFQDYGKVSLIDAALKADKENFSTADVLQAKDILQGKDFFSGAGRFAVGLAGDIITDPTSYLSFGATGVAKVGGKALSKKGATVATEAVERLTTSKLANLNKQLTQGLIDEKTFQSLANAKRIEAGKEAALGIRQAASLLKDKKDFGLLKFDDAIKKEAAKVLNIKEGIVKEGLGLGADDVIDELFTKPAIRVSSLFSSKTVDLPIITDLSEDLFSALGGPLYNLSFNVGKKLDKLMDASKVEGSLANNAALKVPLSIIDAVRKAPKLFSRRIAAGGKVNLSNLKEHEAQMAFLYNGVAQDAETIFRGFDSQELSRISEVLQSGIKQRLGSSGLVTGRIEDVVENAGLFEQAVDDVVKAFDAATPGKGDLARRLILKVKDDFALMGKEATDLGQIDNVVNGYLHGLYTARDGIPEEQIVSRIAKSMQSAGKPERFTLDKVFFTLDEAKASGLTPVTDLKQIWTHRTVQQQRMKLEKELVERMGFETALPKSLYDKIQRKIFEGNEREAEVALDFLRQRGLKVNPLDAIEGKTVSKILVRDPLTNLPLDGDNFDTLVKLARETGTPRGLEAREKVAKLFGEININDDAVVGAARETVETGFNKYKELNKRLLGRLGESNVARAGAQELPTPLKEFIGRVGKNLTPEEKIFYNGALPESFVGALNESYNAKSLIRDKVKELRRNGMHAQADAAETLIGAYTGYLKVAKKYATIIWPGYHIRNLYSGQLMAAQAVSPLGESLNIFNMLDNSLLMKKGGMLVQKGSNLKIPAAQLRREMGQYGVVQDLNATLDIMDGFADVMGAQMGKRAKKIPKTRIGKAWKNFEDMSGHIENFGRQHLYINLRRNGHDAASAAEVTNRVMIDYARGKTSFERNVMNNTIFFYSFARGSASNMFHALVSKPGTLTNQLYAVDAFADAIKDPDAIPPAPDLVEEARTFRANEGFARFIGRTEEGEIELATSFGMPVEELGRFFSFESPDNMSVSELAGTLTKNAGRSLRTILAQTNPVIKNAIQLATDKDIFFNRPLTDKTLRKLEKVSPIVAELVDYNLDSVPFKIAQKWDASAREILGARDNGDGTFTVNPYAIAALSFFPGADRARTTLKFLSKPDVRGSSKAVRFFSGVRSTDVDLEKSAVFDRQRRLKQFIEEEALPSSKKKLKEYLANN